MDNYKNKLGNLADRLKKESPKTPMQEVTPVKRKAFDKNEEAQLNTWIPKVLLKKMKSYGIENSLSLKVINILALNNLLVPASSIEAKSSS